jgi:NAD+ diphosphatase
MIAEKSAYWFVFQHDKLLLLMQDDTSNLLTASALSSIRHEFIRSHLLTQFNDVEIYCAELNPAFEVPPPFIVTPFRKALDILDNNYYSFATKAYSIINWDRNHQFCGRCGNLTEHAAAHFERKCMVCQLAFYPRISPSVIVAIQRNDELLMARSPHFPQGVFGLIAGFVEAGESVEEAIHREVKEEVGIQISNLQYITSQSWPFPDSLMLGFVANYTSGDIVINHDEIESAGWYRYDQLPGRPSTSISIANQLIDYVINQRSNHGSVR